MKNLLIFLFLLISSNIVEAEDRIKVRLYTDVKIAEFVFTPMSNGYRLMTDDSAIIAIPLNKKVNISLEDLKVKIKFGDSLVGIYKKVQMLKNGFINSFQIQLIKPDKKPLNFDDGLIVSILDNSLIIINYINIDYYVAGVVEAEGGSRAPMEYFKTQAVLCRTYVLGHFYRHTDQGYNICDKVHCQVYRGKCRNSDILMAAIATRGMTLVDSSGNYILSAFHSNCGGQTVSSLDVWTKSMPYLRPVTDTFCRNSQNAKWDKKIPVNDWINYLKSNGCSINQENMNDYLTFKQPFRKSFYDVNGAQIPLKNFRTKFNLKSTFFETTTDGSYVLLTGRGHGHGVGMCQEGAMKMALSGYNYLQIIDFYFHGVKISYKQIPE
ncbi:MAG: SpoIID/LytB domain-containing protein [Bacteroidota bacterium]